MASPQDSPRDNDAPNGDGDDRHDDAPARRSRSRSPADRRERSRSRSPRGRSRSRSRSPARGGYGSSPPPRGERKTGVAGRWNPRGFGFITPDQGGEDLFCHFSSITDGNMLNEGARVEYDESFDDRKGKPRAERVTGGTQGEDRGPPPPRDNTCRDFMRGNCNRENCRFSHGDSGGGYGGGYGGGRGGGGGYGGGGYGGGGGRSDVCYDFQKGNCTRQFCKFSHDLGGGGGGGYGGGRDYDRGGARDYDRRGGGYDDRRGGGYDDRGRDSYHPYSRDDDRGGYGGGRDRRDSRGYDDRRGPY